MRASRNDRWERTVDISFATFFLFLGFIPTAIISETWYYYGRPHGSDFIPFLILFSAALECFTASGMGFYFGRKI
jgi:hypothetical protein